MPRSCGALPRLRASRASCPSGTEVVGTGATLGATVTGGQVAASLRQVRPSQQGRYVYIEGVSHSDSWNSKFGGLSSYAVCADADLGQHVHIDGTELNDDRVQFAPVSCGADEVVTVSGLTTGDTAAVTGRAHVESMWPLHSSLDKVQVEASSTSVDPAPWNIAAGVRARTRPRSWCDRARRSLPAASALTGDHHANSTDRDRGGTRRILRASAQEVAGRAR